MKSKQYTYLVEMHTYVLTFSSKSRRFSSDKMYLKDKYKIFVNIKRIAQIGTINHRSWQRLLSLKKVQSNLLPMSIN